jgi:hypothetical protein
LRRGRSRWAHNLLLVWPLEGREVGGARRSLAGRMQIAKCLLFLLVRRQGLLPPVYMVGWFPVAQRTLIDL